MFKWSRNDKYNKGCVCLLGRFSERFFLCDSRQVMQEEKETVPTIFLTSSLWMACMRIGAIETILAHYGKAKSITESLRKCLNIIGPWVPAGSLALTPWFFWITFLFSSFLSYLSPPLPSPPLLFSSPSSHLQEFLNLEWDGSRPQAKLQPLNGPQGSLSLFWNKIGCEGTKEQAPLCLVSPTFYLPHSCGQEGLPL